MDRCDEAYDYAAPCACNSECGSHGNCCDDYNTACSGKKNIHRQLLDFNNSLLQDLEEKVPASEDATILTTVRKVVNVIHRAVPMAIVVPTTIQNVLVQNS